MGLNGKHIPAETSHVWDLMKHHQNSDPEATVLIPVYNEEKMLLETLRSVGVALAQVSTRYAVEVLCVDSESTDGSAKIMDDCGVRRVDSEKGAGNAVLAGMQSARGRNIIRTDGDCLVAEDFFHLKLDALLDEEVAGYAGEYRFLNPAHPLHTAYFGMKKRIRKRILDMNIIDIQPTAFCGSNMAWDNTIFEGIDWLPDRHQDAFIGQAVEEEEGRKVIYNPEDIVLTDPRRYEKFGGAVKAIWEDGTGFIIRRLGIAKDDWSKKLVDVR